MSEDRKNSSVTFTSKNELRRLMKQRRAEAYAQNPHAPEALRDLFMKEVKLPPTALIAGYMFRDHEMDAGPLLKALHTRGHRLVLPVMAVADQPLVFRAYEPGDSLIPDMKTSILEPAANAPVMEPDVLLVPLLAFDKRGHRLGRGGGHYDRTLADMRQHREIIVIGLAYDCQQIETIPADSHDAKLDKIATETEVITVLNSC